MSLPQPLPRFDLGEVLGHLRTGGQVPFLDASGEALTASLWFVVCEDRCWLLAATGDQRWATASADVALEKGWTWDALRVGDQSAPLRRGTRKDAERLLRRFRKATGGGEAIPRPGPVAPATVPGVARGAVGLPDWIAEVEGPAEAWWLFGVETGRAHPFVGRDGTVQHEPVWLLLSDQHQVLATASGWRRPAEEVGHVSRTARRDRLLVDGWVLPATGISEAATDRAGEMAPLDVEGRWEAVLRHQIEAGAFEAVQDLLAHAFVLDRHQACWEWIGQLALETGETAQAVQAAVALLGETPDLDLEEATVRWVKQRPRGARPVPAGLFADRPALTLPPGLPWPPEGALEVLGTAAILVGRVDDGLAAWAHRGRTARAVSAMAAVAVAQGADDAVERWVEAAERWRPSDPTRAREALAAAIAVASDEDVGPLYWRLGAWSTADDVEASAHWRHAVATLPPDDLVQSIDGWRGAALTAEAEGAYAVAAVAWDRVASIDAFEREALVRAARVHEHHLDDVPAAIASLEELERRSEAVVEPDPSLATIRLDIARLAEGAGDRATAAAALRRAVEGDFLSLAAWDAVLEAGTDVLDAGTLAWFQHVRAVLGGGATEAPGPLRASLTGVALDALHPGGVGWLERARQSVDTAKAPERSDLVRGLERLAADDWPVLSEAVASVSASLGIPAPDVYLFRGEGAWGLSAWPTEPPLVLVGHDHLRDAQPVSMSRAALRFALAVEITHLAARHPLLAFDGGLVGTSRSVYEAFGRYAGTAETVVDVVTLLPGIDQLAKIQTLVKLSRRVFTARAVVDKATDVASTSMGFLGWSKEQEATVGRTFEGVALQFRLQADRSALLLTGDLGAAVEAVVAGSPAAAVHRGTLARHGVVGVLEQLPVDARLRIAALVGFASTLPESP
jgi:hypothetical protein